MKKFRNLKWKKVSRLYWSDFFFNRPVQIQSPENGPPIRSLVCFLFYKKFFAWRTIYKKYCHLTKNTKAYCRVAAPPNSGGRIKYPLKKYCQIIPFARAADVRCGRGLRTQTSQQKISQYHSLALFSQFARFTDFQQHAQNHRQVFVHVASTR